MQRRLFAHLAVPWQSAQNVPSQEDCPVSFNQHNDHTKAEYGCAEIETDYLMLAAFHDQLWKAVSAKEVEDKSAMFSVLSCD